VYRIHLIHWNASEAIERAERLRAAGYRVTCDPFTPAEFKKLKQTPPAALVIDLARLPSHGRDVAMAFRGAKATRHIPLVFVGGESEKVERIRQQLPGAIYANWRHIRSAVRRAVEHPPSEPAVPTSSLAGYSGTPLVKKLGIKAGGIVAFVNAPDGFVSRLKPLPEGVTFRHQARGRRDLTIWFTKSMTDFQKRLDRYAAQVAGGGLWIAWPKKASGVDTDLTQAIVRRCGLAAGLVDYKICAIDDTWSALKFACRKKPKGDRHQSGK